MKAKFISITLFVLLTAGIGCAGKPEVPDKQADGREYRSLKKDQQNQEQATAPQSGEQSAASGDVVRATGPVATVNGKQIAADEFNQEIQRIVATGIPPAMTRQFKDKIVEKLVDRHLIDAEIQKQNVEVSDAEVDAKLEEVREEFAQVNEQNGQQADLDDLVQQLGISQEELRDSIEQSIAIEKLLEKRGFEEPADSDVKKFYEDNKEKFERPEQVRARHILIKVDAGADEAAWEEAKKKAEDVRKQAQKDGANFEELAKTTSEGPSAPAGGDLGYFSRGRMVPEFEEAAFKMKKGEISKPVKTQFGWHIIKVEDKREAGPVPFEEVEDQLSTQLKSQAMQEALVAFVSDLRGTHKVEIHEENIQ